MNKQREAIVKKVWNKISQKLSQSYAFSGGKRGDVQRLQKWLNTSKCSEKKILRISSSAKTIFLLHICCLFSNEVYGF